MKKPQAQSFSASTALVGTDPLAGPRILPVERLKLFSEDDWEAFVAEWVDGLRDQYQLVERVGGAGDQGCDVIATVDPDDPNSPWDNYQCKRLGHPLQPEQIWPDIGKLCYYTFVGEYEVPRRYFFACSRGAGGSATSLLKKPQTLKAELLAKWAAKCSPNIKRGGVPLTAPLRAHIEALDFSIFRHLPPLKMIEAHAKTRYHAIRFGAPLPARGPTPVPPPQPAASETRYVQQLLEAYGDNQGVLYQSPDALNSRHSRHFKRARECFYCAEELRNFSRDSLPEGAFEHLQRQIYDGVVDVCDADHPCGFSRVEATTERAVTINPTSSALVGRTDVADKKGICHQLANEDRLTWVPKRAGK